MTLEPLLAELEGRGISLKAEDGRLRVSPASLLDDKTLQLLKRHKPALLALLEPERDAIQSDCPGHWTHIPELPPKGEKALSSTPEKPERYRVKLFGMWYIVRFEPNISETAVSITCKEAKRRLFANLNEFYRWAWSETYAQALAYREVN